MKKVAIFAGSLVGALAIHLALAACGSSTSASAVPDARAQVGPATTAAGCKNWSVSTFFATNFLTRPDTGGSYGDFSPGLAKAIALPPGWEPTGITPWPVGNGQNYGAIVTVRSCTDGT